MGKNFTSVYFRYYEGVVYRFDSFIQSFLAWLKIVEFYFHCVIEHCDISGWMEEIIGHPGGRIWTPPGVTPVRPRRRKTTPDGERDGDDTRAIATVLQSVM